MKPAKAKCRIGLRFYTILQAFLVVVLILFTCLSSVEAQSDGVWTWGLGLTGQLGNGTNKYYTNVPVQANIRDVIAVSAGGRFTAVIKSDGTVWTWGWGLSGQFGNGTNTNSNIPVQANITDVIAVSAGGDHAVALKSDGTVWTWGENLYWALGNGTNTNSNVPVEVNITDVIAVSAGGTRTVALKSDGTVWAWGNNSVGQLGNGTNTNSNIPVEVNIADVIAVSTGGTFTVALKLDGTVWTWGGNSAGQLGNGTNTNSNIPVQASIRDVIAVSAGGGHTVALKLDGTVWSWGNNSIGQLGNGTRISRKLPAKAKIRDVIAVSAGADHTVALKEIRTTGNPFIDVSPKEVNFGSVRVGSTYVKPVTIKNTGIGSLTVNSITIVGTNEFSQSNECPIVPPGSSCTFNLAFAPITPYGKKSAVMSIISDDPKNPTINIKLLGQAPPPKISVSPMSVNLHSIPVGGTSFPKMVNIKNSGISDLVIDSISINGTNASEFRQSNDCTTVQAKSSCTVSVTFMPTLPYGKKSAVMSIASNDPKKPTVNVKLSGQAPPPKISVSPMSVNLGSIPVGGTSLPKTITIKNAGTSDLIISSMTLSGLNESEFSQTHDCTTVTKGSSCTALVTFIPLSIGNKNALISISSNDPKEQVVNGKLTGKGL